MELRLEETGFEKSRRAIATPAKLRLDLLLAERGLVPSRERARALILAGRVLVKEQKVDKPGTAVAADAPIRLLGEEPAYVSRGGLKLEGALSDFALSPAGKICMDIGSSTGGFTDCLLQNGALQVFAVDVSIDQLDWKLVNDQRVVKIERNARYLKLEDLPSTDIASLPTLVTMDVSFISVSKVLPAVAPVAAPNTDFLILVKRHPAPKSDRTRAIRRTRRKSRTPGPKTQPPPRHRRQSGIFSPRPQARRAFRLATCRHPACPDAGRERSEGSHPRSPTTRRIATPTFCVTFDSMPANGKSSSLPATIIRL